MPTGTVKWFSDDQGYGPSDDYRQIFQLPRLGEAVSIRDSAAEALTAATGP
jgi:hypothetical protein